jgi:hypothetical protein
MERQAVNLIESIGVLLGAEKLDEWQLEALLVDVRCHVVRVAFQPYQVQQHLQNHVIMMVLVVHIIIIIISISILSIIIIIIIIIGIVMLNYVPG